MQLYIFLALCVAIPLVTMAALIDFARIQAQKRRDERERYRRIIARAKLHRGLRLHPVLRFPHLRSSAARGFSLNTQLSTLS